MDICKRCSLAIGWEDHDTTIYELAFYKAGSVDRGSYVYDGDRSNDKELFTITTNTGVDSYYCSNSNCLKKVNNIYILKRNKTNSLLNLLKY